MRSLMYTASIGRVTIRSICADRPTLVQTLNLLHIDQHTYPLPIHSTGPAQSQYKGWFPTCRTQCMQGLRRRSKTERCNALHTHKKCNTSRDRTDFVLVCVAFFMCVHCVQQVGNRPWTSVSVLANSSMLTSAHRTSALHPNRSSSTGDCWSNLKQNVYG